MTLLFTASGSEPATGCGNPHPVPAQLRVGRE
jgi:hypothetical protein